MTTLRLVRDDGSENTGTPAQNPLPNALDTQLAQLQEEITSLKAEINFLHRRDETLNFYMLRLDEELRLAAKLQQDFLPKSLPQVGRVHFHTLFRPAGYVSGDLYDVSRLDEAHVGFYMADAVGHGMPAALLTMFIKNALVTKLIQPGGYRLLDPGDSLARLNATLVEQNLTQATFATAIYGTINTKTLVCRFARGGHPCPLLMRAAGGVDVLNADGGLLGIFPEEVYENGEVQLCQGDRLFVYSDGIEVAFANDIANDSRQWRAELERRRDMPTPQLLAELSESLDRENGSLQPKDDVSMIIAEVI